MNGPTMTDVALLVPELILVGTALVLIVAARNIQKAPAATAAATAAITVPAVARGAF